MVRSKNKMILKSTYDLFSYIYRYFVRYLFKHKLLKRLEYEYRFGNLLHGFNSIDHIRATLYLSNLNTLNINKNYKYAYIPLHYTPEATTDYWIDDLFYVDYENSILDTVSILIKDGYKIIVKEHPSFF